MKLAHSVPSANLAAVEKHHKHIVSLFKYHSKSVLYTYTIYYRVHLQ